MINSEQDINGVVLIGGKSRRMSREKYALELGGTNLLEKAVTIMEQCGLDVYVSCSKQQNESNKFRYPIIIDRWDSEGPLSGIYSALLQLKSSILILAIDYPKVGSGELLSLLNGRNPAKEATLYYEENTKYWPCLCSIIEFKAIHKLESYFNNNRRSVRRFYETLEFETLEFDRSIFFNMNTIEEYRQFREGNL